MRYISLILSVAALALIPLEVKAETFHGYDCGDDCSGHQAGYDWAEQNNILDPDQCQGRSDSFNEGCQAWVEENQAQDEGDTGGDEE